MNLIMIGRQKILYGYVLMKINLLKKVSKGLLFVNFLMQYVLRINGRFPFLIHFTSVVRSAQGFKVIDENESINIYQCFANSNGLYINAKNGIEVHSSVFIASGVKLISANHNFTNKKNHIKEESIVIERGVWIGTNAVVLPGVKIGVNSVVGAGSVVTKNVPPFVVVAGNPAKVIKEI